MIDSLWLLAFALTLAIEVPIVVAFAPRRRRLGTAGIAACVQMVTHPLAWLAYQHDWIDWWSLECAVVIVEGLLYAWSGRRAAVAIGISLLANATSASLGSWWLQS